MLKRGIFLVLPLLANIGLSGCLATTGSLGAPRPASFAHLWTEESHGQIAPFTVKPKNIYGMGLTYASHLKEIGQKFDPDIPPAIFKKGLVALNQDGSPVKIPTRDEIIAKAEEVEEGLGDKIDKKFEKILPLLDYEVELGFVLLENADWGRIADPGYAPKIGYFIANDISLRDLAILGEGMPNRYEYWGASKSFPNFLPVGRDMWVPGEERPDSILSVVITTKVNGEIRQRQSTDDMIYTPREMLGFIHRKYPHSLPVKGDIVLTGTPGGVALQVPAWKKLIGDILRLDRFAKLLFTIKTEERSGKFLESGDIVEISGGMLGKVETHIIR
ncbi:MAG: fumarylacetoacetate hydrolase family protein [Candidatus Omnitrophota bacterium]